MEVILLKGRYFILGCLIGVLIVTIVYAPLTGSQSVGMYDPWKDLNDDGIIDIYDLVSLANSYGSEGLPEKYVYVLNWPKTYKIEYLAENKTLWDPGHIWWLSDVVQLEGFGEITVFLKLHDLIEPGGNINTFENLTVQCYMKLGNITTQHPEVFYEDSWQKVKNGIAFTFTDVAGELVYFKVRIDLSQSILYEGYGLWFYLYFKL